jgi:hypothetical protein
VMPQMSVLQDRDGGFGTVQEESWVRQNRARELQGHATPGCGADALGAAVSRACPDQRRPSGLLRWYDDRWRVVTYLNHHDILTVLTERAGR